MTTLYSYADSVVNRYVSIEATVCELSQILGLRLLDLPRYDGSGDDPQREDGVADHE